MGDGGPVLKWVRWLLLSVFARISGQNVKKRFTNLICRFRHGATALRGDFRLLDKHRGIDYVALLNRPDSTKHQLVGPFERLGNGKIYARSRISRTNNQLLNAP